MSVGPPIRINEILRVVGDESPVHFDGPVAFDGSATFDGPVAFDSLMGTQALRLPICTTVQRDAILTPTPAMLIYNSTTNKLNFYAAAAWEAVTSA